jgi:hypothetical protein
MFALGAQWLVTSDGRRGFLRHAVRPYLADKQGRQELIWCERSRRAATSTAC